MDYSSEGSLEDDANERRMRAMDKLILGFYLYGTENFSLPQLKLYLNQKMDEFDTALQNYIFENQDIPSITESPTASYYISLIRGMERMLLDIEDQDINRLNFQNN